MTPIKIKIRPPRIRANRGLIKCIFSPIRTPIKDIMKVTRNIINMDNNCSPTTQFIPGKLMPITKASILVAILSKIMTLKEETSKTFSFRRKFLPSINIFTPIINNRVKEIHADIASM